MASGILCNAFIARGEYATGFAMFGAEPRGAPVTAFVRFDKEPIKQKTQIYHPNCLIIVDSTQAKVSQTYVGLKPGSLLIINAAHPWPQPPHPNVSAMGVVNATQISLEEIGRPITNSCMLGAFAATTGWVDMESVLAALKKYFKGDSSVKNARSAEREAKEVQVSKW